jgi:hypothetical protein
MAGQISPYCIVHFLGSSSERLPKEEQIRCVVYRWLYTNSAKFVHVEAGYRDTDKRGKHPECDIHTEVDGNIYWIEIKSDTADAPGYISKPKKSLESWKYDIDKLSLSPNESNKVFIVVGIRKTGRKTRLYSQKHIDQLTKYIQETFPNKEISLLNKTFPLCAWRDITPAEICCFLWSW